MGVSVTDHLDRLAAALADAGWSSRPRYEDVPVALRAFDPAWPRYGDTITVTTDIGTGAWFWSSVGAPLAPVEDAVGAVRQFEVLMEEFRSIAERLGLRDPARHRRCR